MTIFNSLNILTAFDKASVWRACNFRVKSEYLVLNHALKLGDLKNFLYNPTQSPLIPVLFRVNWGPDDSRVAKK